MRELRRYPIGGGQWKLYRSYRCEDAGAIERAVLKRLRAERMLFASSGSREVFRTSGQVIDGLIREEAERLGLTLHPDGWS